MCQVFSLLNGSLFKFYIFFLYKSHAQLFKHSVWIIPLAKWLPTSDFNFPSQIKVKIPPCIFVEWLEHSLYDHYYHYYHHYYHHLHHYYIYYLQCYHNHYHHKHLITIIIIIITITITITNLIIIIIVCLLKCSLE